MVFHWEAKKYKFSGKDSWGSKSLTQLAVSPSRASCCYLFKSWSFLWMFSNSLTITGCVSRCKSFTTRNRGPDRHLMSIRASVAPPRYFVVRTWRHLEIDPQFSARIENLSSAPLKTDTGLPPIHMVPAPLNFWSPVLNTAAFTR